MAGRPKPTKLKILEGNPGKRPLPKTEPKPRPISGPPPKHLDKDAKKFYEKYMEILDRVGLSTEADGDSFSLLCQMFAEFKQLNEAIKKCENKLLQFKHTVDGAGNEHVEAKINPLLVQRRQLYQNIRPYLSEFGLTPRGRVGLVVGTHDKKKKMEKFID